MKNISQNDKDMLKGLAYSILGMIYSDDENISDEQRDKDMLEIVKYCRDNSDAEGRKIVTEYVTKVTDETEKKLGMQPELYNDGTVSVKVWRDKK